MKPPADDVLIEVFERRCYVDHQIQLIGAETTKSHLTIWWPAEVLRALKDLEPTLFFNGRIVGV